MEADGPPVIMPLNYLCGARVRISPNTTVSPSQRLGDWRIQRVSSVRDRKPVFVKMFRT